MQISVMGNAKIKEKAIYSGSEELIISILAYFLLFKIAIQNMLSSLLGFSD